MANEKTSEIDQFLDGSDALSAIVRSEVDLQISTAHRYPRDLKRFHENVMSVIVDDPEIAGEMFYALPRGDSTIEGPSVRMAELVAAHYGNLRAQSRILGIDERFITAQGVAHDLESNYATSVEVKRRITNKRGQRFNDDMIQVTANAACSIAIRQAIFKVVPFVYARQFFDAARKTSVGDQKNLKSRRKEMLTWFSKLGVDESQILAVLGVKTIDDIGSEHLITLRGLATALRDGEVKLEDAFPTFRKGAETKTENPTEKEEVGVSDLLGGEETPKEWVERKPLEDDSGTSELLEDEVSPKAPETRKEEKPSESRTEPDKSKSPTLDDVRNEKQLKKLAPYLRQMVDRIESYKQPRRIRDLMMEIEENTTDYFPEDQEILKTVGEDRLAFLAEQSRG